MLLHNGSWSYVNILMLIIPYDGPMRVACVINILQTKTQRFTSQRSVLKYKKKTNNSMYRLFGEYLRVLILQVRFIRPF